jgi:hypothetical protein
MSDNRPQKQFSRPEEEGSPFLLTDGTFYHYRGQKPKMRSPPVQQPPQKPKNMDKVIYAYVPFIFNYLFICTYFNRNALLTYNLLY